MRENIYFCLCAYGHIRFLFSCIKAKEDDDDFCLFAFSSSCLPRRVYYLSVRVSFFFLIHKVSVNELEENSLILIERLKILHDVSGWI